MKRIGQGNTAEVFAWGKGKILKLARPGIPSAIIEKEFHVIQSLNSRSGLAPKAYELIKHEGRTGAVYECIQGSTLIEALEKKPWRVKAVGREMAHCHHALLTSAITLELPTLAQRLTSQIESIPHLSGSEKQQVFAILDQLPQGNALCHYDLHPGNIMRAENGRLYVIDWANACSGTPAADICRSDLIGRYGSLIGASPLQNLFIHLLRSTYRRSYRRELNKRLPTSKAEISAWRIPIMAARLAEAVGDRERNTLQARLHRLLANQT